MGCGSQTGCLGPKPRQREVYLDTMETIHQQAKKMQVPSKQDLYVYVRGQLTKKGLIKKLIDNLVSHKSNLYQCANHILELTVGASTQLQYVSSLVVVDKIIDEFFKLEEEESPQQTLKKSIAIESIVPIIFEMALPSVSEISVNMAQRVNVVYFKLIIVLMQKQFVPMKDVLSSLSNFLLLRSQKLMCKIEIFKLFDLLIENIRRKQLVALSAEVFALMLSRIKQNFYNEISQDYMIFFVKNWFYGESKESEEKVHSFKRVIKQFFNRMFGNAEVIALALINLLDEVCFEKKQADKIEQLLEDAFDNKQSKKYLIRSLSVYLLRYLKIGEQGSELNPIKFKNVDNQKARLNGFILLVQWSVGKYVNINSLIQYNPSAIVEFYVINTDKVISQPFRKQLKEQYFRMVQSISNESVVVLTNFLVEEMREQQVQKERRDCLFGLLREILQKREALLSDQNYNTNMPFVVDLQRHYSKEMKFQLISFATRHIKILNILKIKSMPEVNNFFRIKLCNFLFSIFDIIAFTLEGIDASSDQSLSNDQFLNKKNKLSNLCKFIQQVIRFVRCLNEYHLQTYILSFISSLNSSLREIDPEEGQKFGILLFLLSYLIQSFLFMMNKKEKISQIISKVSAKLQSDSYTNDLGTEMILAAKELMESSSGWNIIGELDTDQSHQTGKCKAKQLIQANQKKIKAARELFMVSEVEWKEVSYIFQQNFGESIRESKKKNELQNFVEKGFSRQPSMNISLNENENERGSTKNEGEQSFREILQRIREK